MKSLFDYGFKGPMIRKSEYLVFPIIMNLKKRVSRFFQVLKRQKDKATELLLSS